MAVHLPMSFEGLGKAPYLKNVVSYLLKILLFRMKPQFLTMAYEALGHLAPPPHLTF